MPSLTNVVPNENWQLVLEYVGNEHRIFDASIARIENGWPELAHPNKLKNLTFNEQGVSWPGGRTLDSEYLYSKSSPIGLEVLARQVLRLGYKNQAPDSVHSSHHVYGVYLFFFRDRPFEVGESIGGGHAEMGGSTSYSLRELLAWPGWEEHFSLSDCAWAIPMILAASDQKNLVQSLIKQVCFREGSSGA